MFPKNSIYKDSNEWVQEFFDKYNITDICIKYLEAKKFKEEHPDCDRPTVMYGIRKKHKCIKKEEIGVIIDNMPMCNRARMAEKHWYKIIYKRLATDIEWEEMKSLNLIRRYFILPYYIKNEWDIDAIISNIIYDDCYGYGIETSGLLTAFEKHFKRKFSI